MGGRTIATRQRMGKVDTEDEWTEFRIDAIEFDVEISRTTCSPGRTCTTPANRPMSITFRLAWRNLWRRKRRTWLTVGAMVFSNILLVFMISLQLGMYEMMIEQHARAQTGHLQVQAPGYKDDHKIRQVVPNVATAAQTSCARVWVPTIVAARAAAFALVSSADRSYGAQIIGVEPTHREPGLEPAGPDRGGRFPQRLDGGGDRHRQRPGAESPGRSR